MAEKRLVYTEGVGGRESSANFRRDGGATGAESCRKDFSARKILLGEPHENLYNI